MRTKSILIAAAIAATAIPAVAQNVYSLNVVGYVNVPVVANQFSLLGSPLNAVGGNNISNVISGLADGFDSSVAYTFKDGALQPVETFIGPDYHAWYPATTTLVPGQGFFFYSTTNATVTFVGEVQTTNTLNLAAGFNLVASTYPSSLSLKDLGLWDGNDSDVLYRWKPAVGAWNFVTFINQPPDFVGWYDDAYSNGGSTNGPATSVAEGFYYFNAGSPLVWKQNFTIQ